MNEKVTINPKKLKGSVIVPPSKSAAHRAILCASLANGRSVIKNVALSEDICATLDAAKVLGAQVSVNGDSVIIYGTNSKELLNKEIFCNESGSTVRFIIPIALAFGGAFSVLGKGRLMERPLDDYFRIFDEKNISYEKKDDRILFDGKLTSGEYTLSGNVSSQYVTGLLLSLSLLENDSTITITTHAESVGYIDMTIEMMKNFGVNIERTPDYRHYKIKGGQKFLPQNITVEGDYSQAAFFLVANELGSCVNVLGLNQKSTQGDREILNIIKTINNKAPWREIDVSQVPDLVPIISVLAAKAHGVTKLTGAARLRLKESDRLASVNEELSKLGVKINEYPDALEIEGNAEFNGAETQSHNDHRIAMALSVAATVANGEIVICGADSVKKSYADFWEIYKSLGGGII